MTTEKQIAANRENARKSTGPRTLNGKRKSRRNAVRHGLTAETVIDVIEEAADYEALAAAINVDFRPATNFELELIARLISLLWRLRRATAIESGLLALEVLGSRRSVPKDRLSVFYNVIPSVTRPIEYRVWGAKSSNGSELPAGGTHGSLSGARPRIDVLRVHTCGLPQKMAKLSSGSTGMRRAYGGKPCKLFCCSTRPTAAERTGPLGGLVFCAWKVCGASACGLLLGLKLSDRPGSQRERCPLCANSGHCV